MEETPFAFKGAPLMMTKNDDDRTQPDSNDRQQGNLIYLIVHIWSEDISFNSLTYINRYSSE